MALNLAYRALVDPESVADKYTTVSGIDPLVLAYAYYEARMFAPEHDWNWFTAQRGLYQHTKLVFNPVPNVVNFYVDNIWSQANDARYPKLVTPLASGTDETLINAVAQLDQWTQWRSSQIKIKRYAAATGRVLVEAVDDAARQKITQRTVWGGHVTQIELNDAGDVQSYTIEYKAWDARLQENYQFKKTVDKEVTRYYKNDRPFAYDGENAEVVHNYGFCPAIYLQHSDGKPAFHDFDNLNDTCSLASHLYDNIHKEIESGKIIFAEKPDEFTVISGGSRNKDGTMRETDARLERVLIGLAGQGSVADMSGLLKLADAYPYLRDRLLNFANDYPELEYKQILKESGQLSGIALERLLTPAQNRLDRAAPNYDEQLIKLRQMQISMAGDRINGGMANKWNGLSAQQEAFRPFNLDSYSKGDLDFNLKPSRLIEMNEEEMIDLQAKKIANANSASGLYALKTRIILSGKTEEEADAEIAQLSKEDAVIASAYGLNNEPTNQDGNQTGAGFGA